MDDEDTATVFLSFRIQGDVSGQLNPLEKESPKSF
jgi:hypothetical protein